MELYNVTISKLSLKDILVCASEAMRSQVREEVARSMHKNMRFVELDFQPPEVAKVAVQKDRSMSVQCRGIT